MQQLTVLGHERFVGQETHSARSLRWSYVDIAMVHVGSTDGILNILSADGRRRLLATEVDSRRTADPVIGLDRARHHKAEPGPGH